MRTLSPQFQTVKGLLPSPLLHFGYELRCDDVHSNCLINAKLKLNQIELEYTLRCSCLIVYVNA